MYLIFFVYPDPGGSKENQEKILYLGTQDNKLL